MDEQMELGLKLADVPLTMRSELWGIIACYYDDRKLKVSNFDDSILWLASEVGELCEAVVQQRGGWTRNDPNKQREVTDLDIARELGDIIMMAMRAGMALGCDPVLAMTAKMTEKTGVTYVVRSMSTQRETEGK